MPSQKEPRGHLKIKYCRLLSDRRLPVVVQRPTILSPIMALGVIISVIRSFHCAINPSFAARCHLLWVEVVVSEENCNSARDQGATRTGCVTPAIRSRRLVAARV